MELQEFVTKIEKSLKDYYGAQGRIETHEIYKNNGLKLQSICVLLDEKNIAPTVYLNDFLKSYEEGEPFSEIIQQIIELLDKNQLAQNLDVDFFTDYEQVKNRLVFRLINKEKNEMLLREVPYMEFQDLAIVCHCLMINEIIGTGSILIHNHHLEAWNITKEEMFKDVEANSLRLEPFAIYKMSEIIRKIMGETVEAQIEEICEQYPQDKEILLEKTLDGIVEDLEERKFPMYVLTNSNRYYGAACLVYKGMLEKIGNLLNSDFYIIPSSVHEIIFLAKSEETEEAFLNEMIQEVNRTQVEPEEWLSDHAYLYQCETKELISII